MNAKIVNTSAEEKSFDCNDMEFEGGFVVFKQDNNIDWFISPGKIAMMEITGRPKKAVKKTKKEA